jgi:hypothetical protein
LECWNSGIMGRTFPNLLALLTQNSIIPFFHYSNFLCSSFL